MDLGLNGKTVLVTGASGGIGREIIQQFANEGAAPVVHYHRNRDSAQALVNQLDSDSSTIVQADLSDETQVQDAFASATDQCGPIDILVANAGIWPPDHMPITDMSVEQWQTTINTNLTSVFLSCREFLRQCQAKHVASPAIVLIGSTAAIYGEAGHGDYASSKSGLIYGLMLTLKNEIVRIQRHGRINTVCPGWTVTPMTEQFIDNGSDLKNALSTIALRKVASPIDIANAVLFLSSSKVAGHITGQVLNVSGGMEGRRLFEDSELDVDRALPNN